MSQVPKSITCRGCYTDKGFVASARIKSVPPREKRALNSVFIFAILLCMSVVGCSGSLFRGGWKAERLPNNPVITPQMFAEAGVPEDGENINGPCLIRIPEWLPADKRADPSARYYLYFADHGGTYIRMAWAASVGGPYTLYRPGKGVLSFQASGGVQSGEKMKWHLDLTPDLALTMHIASPDVLVDHERRRFVLFFHACSSRRKAGGKWEWGGQRTFAASCENGLDFNRRIETFDLGPSYFRIFRWREQYYASAFNRFHRADEPGRLVSRYARVEVDFPALDRVRHTAVRVEGDHLTLFFSRKGSAPEHIEVAEMRLHDDPARWSVEPARSLLVPEHPWEGVDLRIETSTGGSARTPVHQLRDPYWFRDDGAREYLLYSVAGENGIAIARLTRE